MEEPNLVYEIAAVAIVVVASALVTLALLGLRKLERYLEARLEVEIPDVALSYATELAKRAAGHAEELALQKLRQGTGKMAGWAKRKEAATWFKAQAAGPVKDWSIDKIEGIIHAVLGEERRQSKLPPGVQVFPPAGGAEP